MAFVRCKCNDLLSVGQLANSLVTIVIVIIVITSRGSLNPAQRPHHRLAAHVHNLQTHIVL